jgi:hypothetical protein
MVTLIILFCPFIIYSPYTNIKYPPDKKNLQARVLDNFNLICLIAIMAEDSIFISCSIIYVQLL